MTSQPNDQLSSDAVGSQAPTHDPLSEIFARIYTVTSQDGLVTVHADGKPTLRDAQIAAVEEQLADDFFTFQISDSATAAVSECVRTARRKTAQAMAQLPGMDPQLRALLLGGS